MLYNIAGTIAEGNPSFILTKLPRPVIVFRGGYMYTISQYSAGMRRFTVNKIYALMVIIITIVTILSGCVIPPKVQPDLNQTIQIEPDTGQPKSENMPKPGEKASIEKKTANAKPMYSNPQSYQVTRTLVIKNDTATISSLRVWLPNIASLECQKDYVSQNTNPNIINQWKDPQVDTSISFWEFSNRPAKNSSLTITDQFEYTCFEINCADFPEQIPSYDKSDPEYTLFTRSEKYIESNDTKIVNTAKEIAGTNTNPVQILSLIHI